MNVKVPSWKTIAASAAAASLALAIGAAPSQAATPVPTTKVSAGLSASELSRLPLTDRHLTGREKANLAVVLQAYHDGEGDSLPGVALNCRLASRASGITEEGRRRTSEGT